MRLRPFFKYSFALLVVGLAILFSASDAIAQTSSFTYQGRLTDGGTPANGNYDLQFALWDSASGGSQVGSTLTLNSVAVSNGIFSVTLDFGANSFPGASRFLEISARAIAAGSFTLLTPRQPVTSTPYAVRSASSANADTATNAATATNATQLGGIAASQYVQTGDLRLSDSRPPTAGSSNYIQNTANPQASTNFNISGNGRASGTLQANVVNAVTQFNIDGDRALYFDVGGNTFVGDGAGLATGPTPGGNSFFGWFAGSNNKGSANSFFGNSAGNANVNGGSSTFIGYEAGFNNQSGGGNTFIGSSAGASNVTGIQHTLIGGGAAVGLDGLSNSTAIGHNARVDQSNSLVLGSISGVNGASASTNVGIGTTAPQSRLHVVGNVRIDGGITLSSLGAASSTQATLCRNTSSEIAFCNSSSLRYKKNISPFTGGLDIVNRLQPINFTWKQDGTRDIGFGAEEVEKVAPLFTFKNDKGEIEGVRYDRLSVLFVNAFQEQQTQLEEQRREINRRRQETLRQQRLIEQQQAELVRREHELKAVKDLVCRSHRRAAVCQ